MKKLLSILFTICLLFSLSVNVQAREVPDLQGTGIINIDLTGVSDGSLVAYKVGDIKNNDEDYSFVLSKEFKDSGVSLENLESRDVCLALENFVLKGNIKGIEQEVVDGNVTFEVPVGLYFIMQKEPSEKYYDIQSFLVTTPTYVKEFDTYSYEVDASPKTEVKRRSNNDETPEKEHKNDEDNPPHKHNNQEITEHKIPHTGLLWWPVPVCMALGIVFISIGLVVGKKREKN